MTHKQFIMDLLAAAKDAGIAEAEVYFQQEESTSIMMGKGEIDQYAVNTSGGLSLRGFWHGKMGMAYTEALDEEAIGMLVENVKESATLITDEDEHFIFAGSPSYETIDSVGDLGTPAQRVEAAMTLERVGCSLDPRVMELGAFTGLDTTRRTLRIVNTHGLDLAHIGTLCAGFVEAIAREGSSVSTDFMGAMSMSLEDLNIEAIARESVENAVFQLGAFPCKSGEMPVIFRHSAMADILETFANVFSADAAQKDLSLLKGKEGDTIAAPCVTLIDDPLYKGGPASCPFDAEGVATYTKNIIDGGVLTTLLHNLKTAKKAGCASTGNAARTGYKGAVTVASSNFYFKPGSRDLGAMVAEMQNGLVITSVAGLHSGANEVSGDFSLLSKGYFVENGNISHAVEQVTVAGNFFTLLKDIVEVGNDLKRGMSSVMSPSVWVKSLSVAGK